MLSWNNGYVRPRKPHFFQIVMKEGEAMRQKRLWIPRRFMNDYGREITKHVQVEDPCGRKWDFECFKSGGEIWCKKGWQDFADYYSLKHGHFVVFQYEGNSHFSVIILDMTATEIDYPVDRSYEFVGENEKEAEEENEVTLDDSTPRLSGKRKESTTPLGRGRLKKRKTEKEGGNKSVKKHAGNVIRKNSKVLRDDEDTEDLYEECDATKSDSNNLKNSCKNTHRVSKTQEFVTSTSVYKTRAFKKVAGLKSKNLSFDVIVKPAYLGGYLPVPIQFARFFFKAKSGDVTLQNLEGKAWDVGYTIYKNYNYARLSCGWRAFARQNNLTTGVNCNFKLINHDKLVFKVMIGAKRSCVRTENFTGVHRCSPKLQSQSSCEERGIKCLCDSKCNLSSKNLTSLTAAEKADVISRAKKAFKSKNPYFMVVMQPSYVKKRLDVPFKFAKTHFIKQNCEIVLQQADGSTLTVECRIRRDRQVAYFRESNWIAFVRDNNLEIGDVCIFELLKPGELLLKVVIIKYGDSHLSFRSMHGVRADLVDENLEDTKTEYDSTTDSEEVATTCNLDGKSSGMQALHREKAGRQSLERTSCSQRAKVFEAANKFISLNPYFKTPITSSNFHAGVSLPAEFMRQTNLGAQTGLMFQLQLGEKRWPVKYLCYPQHNVRRFSLGWKVFANKILQVGDVCAFELVDTELLVLKVTIFSCDDSKLKLL